MKKISLLLMLVMIGLMTIATAQKPFAGTVKYSSKIEGTTDPNILSQAPPEYDMTVYGNKTKTVIIFEGGGITSIFDGDTRTSILLYEIMGMGKFYLETTAAEIDEKTKTLKYDYNYTGEKKTIAGYETEKVIVSIINLETDEEHEAIVYVSKELNSGTAINADEFIGMSGFPMRTEMKQDNDGEEITIITEAISVTPNKKVKAVDFMLPSDAKDVKSDPELRKQFGLDEAE